MVADLCKNLSETEDDLTLGAYPLLLQRQMRTNTYFSQHHRLLYVATPKVACTTFKWWFAEILGLREAIEQASVSLESDQELVIHDTFARVAPEYTGANEIGLVEALASPDYFRFCVVRNPYTRVFSAWQSKWLLREPLQSNAYPDAVDERAIDSAADIRAAFEAFLRAVAAVDYPERHDVHVAPQWALLEPQRVSYRMVGQIEDLSALVQALAAHLEPDLRNSLSGGRANVSLLPYSAEWISDEAARLIRTIYARDFELFGYDMTVPAGAKPLSGSSLTVALRSIKLLRGRNTRIGELIGRLSEVPAIPAVSTMQLFWSENKDGNLTHYSESRSAFTSYQLDGMRQTLKMVFPNDVSRVVALRFDPSNQPAAMIIHMISVETADGKILWRWNENKDVFQGAQGVVMRQVQGGLLTICFNNDPQCALAIPEGILDCIGGSARLKVEMTPRPLHEVCAEVMSQDDWLIADLCATATDISIGGALNAGAEVQSYVSGILRGPEEIANLLKSGMARRDQIISEQSIQICAMRGELLRAEAQLNLLKDVMQAGCEQDRL